jgi:hypothetical protein
MIIQENGKRFVSRLEYNEATNSYDLVRFEIITEVKKKK